MSTDAWRSQSESLTYGARVAVADAPGFREHEEGHRPQVRRGETDLEAVISYSHLQMCQRPSAPEYYEQRRCSTLFSGRMVAPRHSGPLVHSTFLTDLDSYTCTASTANCPSGRDAERGPQEAAHLDGRPGQGRSALPTTSRLTRVSYVAKLTTCSLWPLNTHSGDPRAVCVPAAEAGPVRQEGELRGTGGRVQADAGAGPVTDSRHSCHNMPVLMPRSSRAHNGAGICMARH